ncbi:hypothetical protein QTQ03_04465 [Micromonospora sp. WMMA1363]|uniref:hypothetical protein n=1 Tax=Micromonospora sp. WMMA1363 TaxID=3053985 RepID=UPI00259CD738|nr:hypothetical protein [Micromonospora sp. WMMA1363]MDM4718886.1 hypothetical protein [Micromonospora sp. WMMA1363]
MSIVEDFAAQVRAATDDLPLGQLTLALERFGLAAERLRWVRQESADPMGVPELSSAIEHAETAGYALRVAQEQLSAYLAAIGLAPDGGPTPGTAPEQRRPAHDPPDAAPRVVVAPEPAADTPAPRWWAVRVAELTGGTATVADRPDGAATDPGELLRRVVREVRSGDRERLRAELGRTHADVGLGLAAVAPPLLRELAGELLGHPPRAEDLPRLHRALDGRVRDLLPGLPAPVLETLLTRVCRMPPPRRADDERPHAADPAVSAGVLAGVLLDRLGRELPTDEERERRATDVRGRQAGVEDRRRAAVERDRAADAEWKRRAAAREQADAARARVAAGQQRATEVRRTAPTTDRPGPAGTPAWRTPYRRNVDG